MMYNLTGVEKAYIAGIIDGEGCIYIDKHTVNKGKNSNHTYALNVRVSMTDRIVYKYLFKLLGGNTYILDRKPPCKTLYSWYIRNKKAYDFLKMIQSFLILKKPQAELGIKYYEYHLEHRCRGGKNNFMPKEIRGQREEFYNLMKKLKEVNNVCVG